MVMVYVVNKMMCRGNMLFESSKIKSSYFSGTKKKEIVHTLWGRRENIYLDGRNHPINYEDLGLRISMFDQLRIHFLIANYN